MSPRPLDATSLVQEGQPILVRAVMDATGAIALHIRVAADRARSRDFKSFAEPESVYCSLLLAGLRPKRPRFVEIVGFGIICGRPNV
jgi:hypothetical protein